MAAGALALGVAVLAVSWHIDQTTTSDLFADVSEVPYRNVAVVLGTARYYTDGVRNEYYSARIAAAEALYREGKTHHIIVSGSNPSRYYNEPVVMKKDLVELGVPADAITEDNAGDRTLDSIVRAHKVMGQSSFTVVSQRFHAARAVFLGRHFGIDVIGYCAQDPEGPGHYASRLREYGARFKALLDVTILDTQPRSLGEPVAIRLGPERAPLNLGPEGRVRGPAWMLTGSETPLPS